MSFRVNIAHEAEKIFDRPDRPVEERLRARFEQLAADPFDPRLSAPLAVRPGIRRSRVGGWRILSTADREAQTVNILTVDTRSQVYRHS